MFEFELFDIKQFAFNILFLFFESVNKKEVQSVPENLFMNIVIKKESS